MFGVAGCAKSKPGVALKARESEREKYRGKSNNHTAARLVTHWRDEPLALQVKRGLVSVCDLHEHRAHHGRRKLGAQSHRWDARTTRRTSVKVTGFTGRKLIPTCRYTKSANASRKMTLTHSKRHVKTVIFTTSNTVGSNRYARKAQRKRLHKRARQVKKAHHSTPCVKRHHLATDQK